MKVYKFHNDTYHQTFYFLPAAKESDYEEFVRKFDGSYHVNLSGYYGITSIAGGKIFVWLREDRKDGLSALCHECIHAANYCLSGSGVHVNENNDEALTYLAEWVFEKCLKHMRVR